MGGTVQYGRVADGRYFLGGNGHVQEVSRAFYFAMYWYRQIAESVFATTLILFLLLNAAVTVLGVRKGPRVLIAAKEEMNTKRIMVN